ncbi:hypothetical protein NDU88_007385 [Pleurodeles waltl]|uniref:Secreted protein n=1 Tax=Pleurodeles waltl TaxID=8319 RepID=A0AAV7LV87_PLEWA|nr:hypothetical protein NDU88_007385 [Pleurodeles waltl]
MRCKSIWCLALLCIPLGARTYSSVIAAGSCAAREDSGRVCHKQATITDEDQPPRRSQPNLRMTTRLTSVRQVAWCMTCPGGLVYDVVWWPGVWRVLVAWCMMWPGGLVYDVA